MCILINERPHLDHLHQNLSIITDKLQTLLKLFGSLIKISNTITSIIFYTGAELSYNWWQTQVFVKSSQKGLKEGMKTRKAWE